MYTKELVIATNNESKVNEYRYVLEPFGITVKTLKDVGIESNPDESGMSYEENALIKAKAAWDKLHVPLFADDSGIEIDALDGAPGLRTNRFCAPEQAAEEILQKMNGVKYDQRTAKLVCAICYIDASGHYSIFRSEVHGHIADPILDVMGSPAHNSYNAIWPYEIFVAHSFIILLRGSVLSLFDRKTISRHSHRGKAAMKLVTKIIDDDILSRIRRNEVNMSHVKLMCALDEVNDTLQNISVEILKTTRTINKIKVENGGKNNEQQ